MAVRKSCKKLSKDSASYLFLKPPSFPYIVEQVTASTELHHENDVLGAVKILIEADDILMPDFPQNHNLLHHPLSMSVLFLLRALHLQILFIDGLDSNKLLGQPVHGEVHLPEGPLPKYLSNPIAI